MLKQGNISRLTTCLAALSAAFTPITGHACTTSVIIEYGNDNFKAECRKALAHPKRFLAQVQSGKIGRPELDSYVRGFDDGKFGCPENKGFVFQILDRFYSVGDRKLTQPALLQRYAFNLPEGYDPAARTYIYNLLWLFTNSHSYLPVWWTAGDARAFVEQPEHWPIAMANFGRMLARDDAVFASVIDPQSRYFDRQQAAKLAAFPSRHKRQRGIAVAALFVDPQFGPPDLALAESLLPASALDSANVVTSEQQQARSLWVRIADAYAQSDDPELRAKGATLHARLMPPDIGGPLAFNPPKDGRVWLSLANWPQKVPNPFVKGPNLSAFVTPDDYPARALREEQTGMVTVAAHFGPDGKFIAVEVVRSSRSALLDEATVGLVTRRYRPKLPEITISGFPGRDVMVPLLAINWQVPIEDEPSSVRVSDGVVTVVAEQRTQPEFGSNCGYTLSDFV